MSRDARSSFEFSRALLVRIVLRPRKSVALPLSFLLTILANGSMRTRAINQKQIPRAAFSAAKMNVFFSGGPRDDNRMTPGPAAKAGV